MRLKRIWSPLTPGAEAFQPTSPATLFTVACTFRLFNFFLSSEIAQPGVSSDADEIDGGGDYVAAWKINIEVSPRVFIYLYRYHLFARVIISPRQTVIQHQRIIPLTFPLKPPTSPGYSESPGACEIFGTSYHLGLKREKVNFSSTLLVCLFASLFVSSFPQQTSAHS